MTTMTENRHLPTEEWLTGLGVEWDFVPNIPLDKIDRMKSLANQSRMDEPINEEVVERYTEDMKRGDTFPPVLARQTGGKGIIETKVYLLGGNHRYVAADRAAKPLDAYVVRCTPEMAMRLMYEDNRRHGFPPSEEDRLAMAVNLIEGQGYTVEDAAKVVGVSRGKIGVAVGGFRADGRAKDLGVSDLFQQLPKTARWRLGAVRSDPVFVEASRLALNTQMKAGEIYTFVTQLNEARSDEQALNMIGDKLSELQDQVTGGGAARPGKQMSAVSRFRQGMSAITAVQASTVVAGITAPDDEQAILLRIESTVRTCNEVQRQIMEKRAAARKQARKV